MYLLLRSLVVSGRRSPPIATSIIKPAPAKKFPLTELPSGITSIGEGAFYDCSNLTLTELPSGITSIGEGVFYNCSSLALTKLPSGITSIGEGAFSGCSNLKLTLL